jgi:hypothetical protein
VTIRGPAAASAWAATALLGAVAIAGCGGTAGPPARPGPDDDAPIPLSTTLLYEPYHAQYRAVSRRHVQQEFNGQVTTTDLNLGYFITARLASADGALDVTLILDSIPLLSGLPMADAAQAAGTRFSATMSPSGQVLRFDGDTSQAELVHQLATGLKEFFPRLPPNGARLGDTWTDTSEAHTQAGQLDLTVRSVNRHEAVEWSLWSGERGLRIVTISNYTLSGTGSESGQAYDLDGSGRSHTDQFVGRDGRFLGLTAVDTLESTATLTSIGAIIPILQTRTDTLVLVR